MQLPLPLALGDGYKCNSCRLASFPEMAPIATLAPPSLREMATIATSAPSPTPIGRWQASQLTPQYCKSTLRQDLQANPSPRPASKSSVRSCKQICCQCLQAISEPRPASTCVDKTCKQIQFLAALPEYDGQGVVIYVHLSYMCVLCFQFPLECLLYGVLACVSCGLVSYLPEFVYEATANFDAQAADSVEVRSFSSTQNGWLCSLC